MLASTVCGGGMGFPHRRYLAVSPADPVPAVATQEMHRMPARLWATDNADMNVGAVEIFLFCPLIERMTRLFQQMRRLSDLRLRPDAP